MLLLSACLLPSEGDKPTPDDGVAVEDLAVTLAEIPTVLHVRWRTEAPTRATVRGRFGGDAIVVEESADATDHAVILAGIPPNTEVEVVVEPDGADPAAATITTGNLPSWVPDVRYSATVPEASAGGYTIAPYIDLEGGGVLILDGAGRHVWAHSRIDGGLGAVTRARLSRDGRAVLYNGMSQAVDAPGYLVRVPLDGAAPVVTEVDGIHTDFVELPDGAYAALGWELRDYDGRTIVGDTVVEVGGDGVGRVVWSAFDSYAPDLDEAYDHWYPGDPDAEDWTHINGLAYDPVEDDFYVTMTWNDAVARVDRGTGALVWDVSDDGGAFARVGDGPLVAQPHSVQRTPGGLLVFNRGDPLDPETCSEAVELALDEAAYTAERGWSYTSEACLLVTFLGSAERLPGGNTLISWTSAGQLDEVTPDGELAWRVNSTIGAGFGFAERVPRLGDGLP